MVWTAEGSSAEVFWVNRESKRIHKDQSFFFLSVTLCSYSVPFSFLKIVDFTFLTIFVLSCSLRSPVVTIYSRSQTHAQWASSTHSQFFHIRPTVMTIVPPLLFLPFYLPLSRSLSFFFFFGFFCSTVHTLSRIWPAVRDQYCPTWRCEIQPHNHFSSRRVGYFKHNVLSTDNFLRHLKTKSLVLTQQRLGGFHGGTVERRVQYLTFKGKRPPSASNIH